LEEKQRQERERKERESRLEEERLKRERELQQEELERRKNQEIERLREEERRNRQRFLTNTNTDNLHSEVGPTSLTPKQPTDSSQESMKSTTSSNEDRSDKSSSLHEVTPTILQNMTEQSLMLHHFERQMKMQAAEQGTASLLPLKPIDMDEDLDDEEEGQL
jgi:hypothetical protein